VTTSEGIGGQEQQVPPGYKPEADFKRLESKLNAQVSAAQKAAESAKDDAERAREHLDKAETDLQLARLGGEGSDEVRDAVIRFRSQQRELAGREQTVSDKETDITKREIEVSAVAIHNARGIPLEVLQDAESQDELEGRVKDWLLEQYKTGKLKPDEPGESAQEGTTATVAPGYENGEGSRTRKGVWGMTSEEFNQEAERRKQEGLRKAANRR